MNTRLTQKTLVTMMVLFAISLGIYRNVSSVFAAGPDVASLVAMVHNGEGESALQLVVETAATLGNWGPAPGDTVVYDRFMSRNVRGAVQDYDDLPDCSNPKISPDEQACIAQFQALEQQVRFGPSLFSTPQDDGSAAPRPTFDDLLSTYIEEVGHSWQEYLYETDGRGNGARTRLTSQAESEHWGPGREYQIKMYILSLDGTLLTLSDQQRANLRGQICDGYANPVGHDVPAYAAPAGWPNPDGWPTVTPTQEALQAFCAG
jgi:hypothetical protein